MTKVGADRTGRRTAGASWRRRVALCIENPFVNFDLRNDPSWLIRPIWYLRTGEIRFGGQESCAVEVLLAARRRYDDSPSPPIRTHKTAARTAGRSKPAGPTEFLAGVI